MYAESTDPHPIFQSRHKENNFPAKHSRHHIPSHNPDGPEHKSSDTLKAACHNISILLQNNSAVLGKKISVGHNQITPSIN